MIIWLTEKLPMKLIHSLVLTCDKDDPKIADTLKWPMFDENRGISAILCQSFQTFSDLH